MRVREKELFVIDVNEHCIVFKSLLRIMSTGSINNESSATTSADTALTSSSPLQPQAQAQTHSLDIPGKLQQQQQQQHQQQQQGENTDAHKDVSPQELTLHVCVQNTSTLFSRSSESSVHMCMLNNCPITMSGSI